MHNPRASSAARERISTFKLMNTGIVPLSVETKRKAENKTGKGMNRSSLLHIIERLEGFLGKLPETIRRPVLHELTPLKELFLQQRAPRFVLTGANRLPLQEIVAGLFAWTAPSESDGLLMELFRWHAMDLGGRGMVSVLDGGGADSRRLEKIKEELKLHPADVLVHLADDDGHEVDRSELDNLMAFSASDP